MSTVASFALTDLSQVGGARRAIGAAARAAGFSQTAEGRVALVVTELGNNVIKHAQRGELVWHLDPDAAVIKIWALDRGRGMANVSECVRDGYSTAGSPGTGLGAAQRLSDYFEIFSLRDAGTVVYAEVAAQKPTTMVRFACAGLSVPFPGETVCGDDFAMTAEYGVLRVMTVDGLGHGTNAATAAAAARAVWDGDRQSRSPVETLQAAHAALRATRGAAMAVAWLDHANKLVRYAGVGNIAATIVTPQLKTRSLVSGNGTVGMELRRMQEFQYPLGDEDTFIMFSDGIASHWRLEQYPGLMPRHPGVIAGVIYRDYKRGRDDATVVVVKLIARS